MRKENRRSFKTVLLMPRVQFKFVGIVAILAGTLPALSLAQMEQLQIQLKRIPQASCLTSKCHPDIDKARVVHGPVQAKGCTVCHIPCF
jgi:hypothetical protein